MMFRVAPGDEHGHYCAAVTSRMEVLMMMLFVLLQVVLIHSCCDVCGELKV